MKVEVVSAHGGLKVEYFLELFFDSIWVNHSEFHLNSQSNSL